MEEKRVKSRLRFAIYKKKENLSTNIFQVVKRHSDGAYLVLQDGLKAELVSDTEIMIKGSPITVTFDTSEGPSRQKIFTPATTEDIKIASAALQHLAYEKGLSADDATEIRHHNAHALSAAGGKSL